jgi:hypothetical protein
MGSRSRVSCFLAAEFGCRWEKRIKEQAPWLEFVAFYSVLANVPYWFVSGEFGFHDLGWFCVQYATVGLVALFVPRLFAVVFFLFIISADLLCGICASFSLPIRQGIEEIGAAHSFSGARLICVGIAILLAALAAATSASLAGRIPKNQRWRAAACLIAFVATLVGADILSVRIATGYLPPSLRSACGADGVDLRKSHVPRLARIPIIRLIRMEEADTAMRAVESLDALSSTAVSNAAQVAVDRGGITRRGAGEQPDLVQVVLESWGLAKDEPLRDALVHSYLQPGVSARYEVIQGSVPFDGSTIPGEARELCGSSIGFHLLNAAPGELNRCLPKRLAALGYDNIALHGMNGNLFERSVWFRAIGFQEIWFQNQFKQAGLPDCEGAFNGTCDADIAAWIGRRLQQDDARPYFIHWMTLNSHLPVLVPSTLPSGAPCEAAVGLTPDTPLCSWYQLVANVHQSVARIATDNLARPTVFVIVGDHAPPFANPALRARFSQTDVPYVVLLPRVVNNPRGIYLAHNAVALAQGRSIASRQTP